VDIEDSTLMGCKIFGAGKGDVSFATTGDVKAYVQFQQDVPQGMHRLGHWPADVFQTILPTAPSANRHALKVERPVSREVCEVAPIVWKNRLSLMKCLRPASGGTKADYTISIEDVETGRELARFAEGYSLASALVHQGTLHVFASRFDSGDWNDVTLFKSKDLKNWEQQVVVRQEGEHLFNSSVCATPKGFVMAYESNDQKFTPFTVKFATSTNLKNWTKLPGTVFGADRYAACPCIRYVDGNYYLLYLEHRTPRWVFETYLARSKDLKSWQLSPANPILTPGFNDGINASDADILEFKGQTYLYYSVGDQRTWSRLRRSVADTSLARFFNGYFPATQRAPAAESTSAAASR
jgi:alpha-L-fucosidase